MRPHLHSGSIALVLWTLRAAVLTAGTGFASVATAEAAGPVFESAEVRLRLVAAEPLADGTVRAALLVDLAPGWKTYWLDPGEAGLPPRIDLSGSTNLYPVAIGFPAPHRFGDEFGVSNGYSEPMAVALTLRRASPDTRTTIAASVALGVCETICVPVAAELALPDAPRSAADAALVEAAHAALPASASDQDGVTAASLSADGKTLTVSGVTSAAEGETAADLFVAGPRGWSFGKPTRVERKGDAVRFDVPVLGKPRKASPQALLVDAVMTAGETSFETRVIGVSRP